MWPPILMTPIRHLNNGPPRYLISAGPKFGLKIGRNLVNEGPTLRPFVTFFLKSPFTVILT